MDIIDVTHWDQYFGTTQQQVVYNSDRYMHFAVQFEQPGLAAGKLNAINTPGMMFTELDIEASQPFCLKDPLPTQSLVFWQQTTQYTVQHRIRGHPYYPFAPISCLHHYLSPGIFG